MSATDHVIVVSPACLCAFNHVAQPGHKGGIMPLADRPGKVIVRDMLCGFD